jgi:hypothetical protein
MYEFWFWNWEIGIQMLEFISPKNWNEIGLKNIKWTFATKYKD